MATSDDELDAILNDLAGNTNTTTTQTQAEPQRSAVSNNADTGLGIDEEIVITKKRIPAPKLDDQRLRSDAGIPRLRRISKERLRFKGKGHEYGDVARMLNMYQLWLDDLYPRAKFADALSIIEKVGHTKRMQVDRKAWIDEGKPRRTREDDEDGSSDRAAEQVRVQPDEEIDRLETGGGSEKTNTAPDAQGSPDRVLETVETIMDEDPDEDELDALLAESALPQTVTSRALPLHTAPTQDDLFADEMEAMADMEDMW